MKISHIIQQVKKQLRLCVFIVMLTSYPCGASSLPEKIIEAEDFFSKEKEFTICDDIYSSKGSYIAIKKKVKAITRKVLLVEIPFVEKGTFSIWIRARDLTLSLRGSNGVNKTIKTRAKSQWEWVSAGRYTSKQIGALFELYALQSKPGTSGLDTVLLAQDPKFRPRGVYNEYVRDGIMSNDKKTSSATKIGKIETVKFTISPKNKLNKISSYLATACVDFPKKHLMDDNPRWDATMKTFFKGNMLILLCRSIGKADKDGNYWDFKTLDRYVAKAKNVWGCKELMFLPQWWLEKPRRHNQAPTKAEMDTGEEVFMQLVRRYGKKGKLNVKYWAVCDEWTLSRYWRNHIDDFVKYYTRLVRKAKAFNPELKIGGPINAWPLSSIITELLEQCPELDFVSWNMYITGHKDTPLDKLYKRTKYLDTSVVASRQISKRIRGKELPVIITAYGPNYRAWNPPDLKLAGPSNGVWQALAMSNLVKGGVFAAGSYNVQARDCGLFGPRDRHGIKGGFIPQDIDKKTIYIRPSARVMHFFQKYIAGQSMCQIVSKNATGMSSLAVNNADNGVAIVLVNSSSQAKNVEVKIKDYKLTVYKEFDLPTEYIYCDQTKVMDGKGFLFNKKGVAKLYLSAHSSYVIYVKLKK